MKFIIAKKIEMTELWQGDKMLAVTKVQAGPCHVTQLRTVQKDGYEAVQMAYGERKVKNIRKPQIGHLKKAKVNVDSKTTFHQVREFRSNGITKDLEVGNIVKADTFVAGDIIQVTATSKGKGFQGVVKRHGFKGTNEQHGNKDQSRMPGSVGATGPAHVFKGTRMGGRMGGDRVTIKTLEVVQVDNDNNIIYIKGGIPGARNGLVLVSGEGELKVSKEEIKEVIEAVEVKEEKVEEVVEVKAEKVEEIKEQKVVETEVKTEVNEVAEEKETKKVEELKPEATTPEEVEKEVVSAKEKVDEAKKS